MGILSFQRSNFTGIVKYNNFLAGNSAYTGTTVSGGTLTSDATYYYRTFTGNGTLTVSGGELSAEVLVIGGGGSGGAGTGGGGGAGGLINIPNYTFLPTSSYTVTIGAGGTNDSVDVGTSGTNTTISNGTRTLTALGGGYGGSSETGAPGPTYPPANGGSGGGAQCYYSGNNTAGIATQPSTTSDGVQTFANTGFGNAGGATAWSGTWQSSSGGGGAGGAGANGSGQGAGGVGGQGKQLSTSGTLSWYAAGGAGGSGTATGSTNGIGGAHVPQNGTAGVINTGSGGGGGWGHSEGIGGNGASGIVIIKYLKSSVMTLPTVTGGTLTSDATYYYRTFSSNGTLSVTGASIVADVLVIAGGGGGGRFRAGGGGAGGVLYQSGINLSSGDKAVVVGAGGATGASGVNAISGTNSSFDTTYIGYGGGYGGGYEISSTTEVGGNGGSGGGAGIEYLQGVYAGGTGVAGQGNAGGSSTGSANTGGWVAGGGGGGAGAVGANAVGNNIASNTQTPGNGGAGTNAYSSWATTTVTGVSGYYAGGGSGSGLASNGTELGGSGGSGGGANSNASGVANTGGGGGSGPTSGAGGSGLVIVRYPKTAVAAPTYTPIRYIRVYANGNNINPSTHFVELQAWTSDATTNRALNRGFTLISGTAEGGNNNAYFTDGDTASANYIGFGGAATLQVDLGQTYTDVSSLKLWLYYADSRTYNSVTVSTSTDGTNFTTIYGPTNTSFNSTGLSITIAGG